MSQVRVWTNRLVVVGTLLVVLPVIVVVARLRPTGARRVALAAIRWGCRATGVRIVTVDHSGRPEGRFTQGPRVYVANHSSPIDVAAVLAACPDATFVAGADLFRLPLLAGAMRALGTIAVDRRSHRGSQLHVPVDQLTNHLSLAVFPEGAIAPAGKRLPFKRSAFALAIELGAEVVPMAIHHAWRVLPPRARLGVCPGEVVVEVLDAIDTGGLAVEDRNVLAVTVEERILYALTADDGGVGSREGIRSRWGGSCT